MIASWARSVPARWLVLPVSLLVAALVPVSLHLADQGEHRRSADGLTRTTTGYALAAASTCPAPGGSTVAAARAARPRGAATGTPYLAVQGYGWGHGLGLSQYGAQGAARLGCDHATILRTYYAGTTLRTLDLDAPVELRLAAAADRTTVRPLDGDVTWTVAGGATRTQRQGRTWTVTATADGLQVRNVSGRLLLATGRGGRLTAAHPGTVVRQRSFAGTATDPTSDLRLRQGDLRLTHLTGTAQVDVRERITGSAGTTAVQKYLRGLGEVPVSWPLEALKAQAVAARTYLTHSYSTSSAAYVIGVTTATQVYAGVRHEDADVLAGGRWRRAVDATAGRVVVDGKGRTVWTMYSSSDGWWSQSRAYVYGDQGGFGYLSAVDDSTWDLASDNPYRTWAASFTAGAVAEAFGFTRVTGVSLGAQGTGARDRGLKVTGVVDGATVTRRFTGDQVRARLDLRSPSITVRWTTGAGTSR